MSNTSGQVWELGGALVGAWAIPALGMRMLVPALLSSGGPVKNFRGRPVFLGLGVVWVFWAIGVTLGKIAAGLASGAALRLQLAPAVALVLLTFVFGFIDDAFGAGAEKGFRGHLRAFVRGRLTTGGLKLIGIGVAALWATANVVLARADAGGWSGATVAIGLVAGAVLVAGSANLLNLLDLRPGRALKGYLFLAGVACAAWLVSATRLQSAAAAVIGFVALAFWFLGPALAVWSYDLGERGMLGDAGANSAGALVGFALLEWLPPWGVVVAAVAVLALNLASERVSFSRVIERSRALAWFDALGRIPNDSGLRVEGATKTAAGADEDDGGARHR